MNHYQETQPSPQLHNKTRRRRMRSSNISNAHNHYHRSLYRRYHISTLLVAVISYLTTIIIVTAMMKQGASTTVTVKAFSFGNFNCGTATTNSCFLVQSRSSQLFDAVKQRNPMSGGSYYYHYNTGGIGKMIMMMQFTRIRNGFCEGDGQQLFGNAFASSVGIKQHRQNNYYYASMASSSSSLMRSRRSSSSPPTTTTSTRLFATKTNNNDNNDKESTATMTTDLTTLRRLVTEAKTIHTSNLSSTPLPYEQILSRLVDLETESSDPSFWDASNSQRNSMVNKEIGRYSRLKEEMEKWSELRGECESALELLEEMLGETNDNNYNNNNNALSTISNEDEEMIQLLTHECQSYANQLIELSHKYELQSLLSGPYDHCSARIILTAGAGGTEACDWVSMLYRMYSRHGQHLEYKVTTTDISDGDVVGYKSVEMEIDGINAYGWFKGEKGAHRLVRLSPFNANNKRQTTFAGVDVIPILEEEEIKSITVPDSELEITTMRSGGKGGQNVNKVETGVRIKHLPSGISVKCTQERSQLMNKSLALARLKAQLLAIAQEQQLQSLQDIRGDVVEASWGAQIRNYVMQPYKMVKDGRTGFETSDVDGVLDGGEILGEFVGSWLRWMRGKEEEERAEKELEGV